MSIEFSGVIRLSLLFLTHALSVGCAGDQPSASADGQKLVGHPSGNFMYVEDPGTVNFTPMEVDTLPAQMGRRELLYVPVYSDIYIREKHMRIPLVATLTVRNVSTDQPIYVQAINFFGSEGDLLHQYLNKPIRLAPMQSIWLVVNEKDFSAGTGANFTVDWGGEADCPDPVVEALMTGSSYQLGISFKSESVRSKAWCGGQEVHLGCRYTNERSIESGSDLSVQ